MSKQTIFDHLRASGLSQYGALALMGNWQCESGCESVRLEGDFDPARRVSKSYADDVDSGRKTQNAYCYDARGWGLAQWTFWSRKQGLYDFCEWMNVSIGDEYAQVEYALKELREGYPALLSFLQTCGESDLYNAVCRVCSEYERPAHNNFEVRYKAALQIQSEVVIEPSAEWPPRKLKAGMSGTDVLALQGVLTARGYFCGELSGKMDAPTIAAVNKFKTETGLGVPGVVGTKTWKKILKF